MLDKPSKQRPESSNRITWKWSASHLKIRTSYLPFWDTRLKLAVGTFYPIGVLIRINPIRSGGARGFDSGFAGSFFKFSFFETGNGDLDAMVDEGFQGDMHQFPVVPAVM